MNKVAKLTERDTQAYLFSIEKIVKDVGKTLLETNFKEISDTHTYNGHESSTLDETARELMQNAIERYLPLFQGIIRCELRPFKKTSLESPKDESLCLIIDELDGTTNTKRAFSGAIRTRPVASISVALSASENIGDIAVGAVFTLDTDDIFSSMKVGRELFLAFHNGRILDPQKLKYTQGDSKKRVCVAGYSNSHRKKKAELEDALWTRGFRPYEGCRASSMDVINIIRNGFDAYIDMRHFWSTKDERGEEKESMLQAYDIAGVLPTAIGCGLAVTDAEGNNVAKYTLRDTIPLIIARADILETILTATRPLVFEWSR